MHSGEKKYPNGVENRPNDGDRPNDFWEVQTFLGQNVLIMVLNKY